MRRLFFLLLSTNALAIAQEADVRAADIRAALTAQQDAWNRGDIVGFMTTYENSDDIRFVGRAGLAKGYRAVLESYRKRYASPAAMGKLTYTILEVAPLGRDHASVVGRFALARTPEGGGDASGIFTLVLRKTKAGWKIIHDHTS